jgi:hypothetical protein
MAQSDVRLISLFGSNYVKPTQPQEYYNKDIVLIFVSTIQQVH